MNQRIQSMPGDAPVEPEFTGRVLTEMQINNRRKLAHCVLGAVVTAMAVGTFFFPLTGPGVPLMVTAALKAAVLLGGSLIIADIFMLVPALGLVHYEWLKPTDCYTLAELCEKHPSLAAYRDQVRALNRRFTYGEFEAMKVWADSRRANANAAKKEVINSEACKRLYGIAQS